MQRIAAGLLSLFCLLPNAAFAEVENWYTYWAIGLVNHNHPGKQEAKLQAADSLPGYERTELAIDMLGFYWPYHNNTMSGFAISGSYDAVADSHNHYIQLNEYLYGFSTMHFFGREIGDGFYLRGDIGVANIILNSNIGTKRTSDTGSGIALGLGYAWAVSEQSRVLFGVRFSNNRVGGENYSSSAVTAGGLW